MRKKHAAVLVGLMLGWMSGTAQSATITQSYDFDAKFLFSPISDLKADFTITFDRFDDTVGNIVSFTSNLSDLYSDVKLFRQGASVVIGNHCRPVFGCSVGGYADQFFLAFLVDGRGQPSLPYAVYSASDFGGAYSSSAKVSLNLVPLPASAPMFGAALLALGAVGYGVKRKTTAAA